MKITFSHQSRFYVADTSKGHDISRAIRFGDRAQATGDSIPVAARQSLELEGFVGDVLRGGSCNVDRLDLIPHCHGTHTETVAHLLQIPQSVLGGKGNELVPLISDVCPLPLLSAVLITVESQRAMETTDHYLPEFRETDRVVSAAAITEAIGRVDVVEVDALILRSNNKLYDFESGPETPFLSIDAMRQVVDLGVDHLLLDLPSVDRLDDGGHLSCHHVFWGLPADASVATKECSLQKTITELVSVDAALADGLYLLDLQVAPLVADAAPSRPVLYAATPV